ncbi:Protein pad-1 [Dirofilaria immitis]
MENINVANVSRSVIYLTDRHAIDTMTINGKELCPIHLNHSTILKGKNKTVKIPVSASKSFGSKAVRDQHQIIELLWRNCKTSDKRLESLIRINVIGVSCKYRAYVAAVDKALKAFETTNEWADLISALAKLSRVFHANAKFGDIPKLVTVAKRLSQCLHPALPHGVHLKALETYRQLFDILGRKDLPRLLYLFAVGLFPLMDHCGIKVKLELLNIFEQYLLPLGIELKPALPGFIAGVLLGLEEGTEFYDRSFSLLDRVQDSVGPEAYFACLWEAVLGSPSVRLPALMYVNVKFNRQKSMHDQEYIMGNNIDHMIAALCAAADGDGSTLIQRHLLDFLSSAFPLNSDHLVREDFVQLLRRCLFLVLRRDMSLNKRLYQWLLNRVGDSAVAGLPVAGVDEQLDTTFFITYALPIAKKAIEEYLKLDTVQVTSGLASWDGTKEHQIQYTEVRVARLLLYFMDRPELGSLLLEETLLILLEAASKNDMRLELVLIEKEEMLSKTKRLSTSIETINEQSRRFSVTSKSSISSRQSRLSILSISGETSADQIKRLEEFEKTINLLMNSLDVGFIWSFLERKLKILIQRKQKEQQNGVIDPHLITNEVKMLKEEEERRTNQELANFPQILLFCLNTIELDSHGDIRERYLPQLLSSILTTVAEKNVASIDGQLLVRLLIVAEAILNEVNQSAVVMEAGIVTRKRGEVYEIVRCEEFDSMGKPSTDSGAIKEQWRVENCLSSCQRLLAQICDWYCKERGTERLQAFHAISTLTREFADFPLYDLSTKEIKDIRHRKQHISSNYPIWLSALLNILSVDEWNASVNSKVNPPEIRVCDVFARANALDLITYIYVRSSSVAEQHAAMIRCQKRDNKERTTILLKPLISETDLKRLDDDEIFKKAATILWSYLGESDKAYYHSTVSRLLCLVHSRKPSEPSSDVEDLIVNNLTSMDRELSCSAAKKFRILWMLNRPSASEELYLGLSSKPFNRVVMLLLGFLSDDAIGYDKTELKNISSCWFNDCAQHSDLPYIFQMWATMLLNPSTSRASIQYLSMQGRMNKEKFPNIPPGICVITLLTNGGHQSLHHLCEDVSVTGSNEAKRHLVEASIAFERLRIIEYPAWLTELRNRLLQEGNNNSTMDLNMASEAQKTHHRTVSDIPMFDDDNDSIETTSLDSLDQEVLEILQYIIDFICAQEESEMEIQACFAGERLCSHIQTTLISDTHCTESEISEKEGSSSAVASISQKRIIESQSVPAVSSWKSTENGPPISENLKRCKGHRRQDSLQESIFTMSAQELKLFDTSELPRLEATGDEVQPLCHELHAHMLLYAESGQTVDLARSEKVFRMLIALLRTKLNFLTPRLIISCMVSSGTASLHKSSSNVASGHLMDLVSRHIRSILGQDFWASELDSANGTDTLKYKHYTFLELFMTISLHFLRSYFVNSPTANVSSLDLRNAWKCKMAVLDFLTELMRGLIAMIQENQSRALTIYIHNLLQRSKLQKCLLHSLLTSVHNVRQHNNAEIVPLSVDILEFNDGTATSSNNFCDLIIGYQNSLLDLTATVIQLELVIKNGFQNFTDQNSSNIDKLSINHHIYNSPQHRTSFREPYIGMVELRMFLLTVLNALKKHSAEQEQWFTFVVRILPFLDRSLSTFSVHIIEQLCKNLEVVVNVAYSPTDDKVCSIPSTESARPHSLGINQDKPNYPTNYAIGILETLNMFFHYCLIDNTSQTGTTLALASQPSQVSNPSLASSVMNAIPGTRGATELISNLVKVFSFSDNTNVSSNAALSKFADLTAEDVWKQARSDVLNAFPHALATLCDVWTQLRKGEPNLPIGNPAIVRQIILDLLSPIVQHHQQAFLSSLALVWMTRSSLASPNQHTTRTESDQPSFNYSMAQLDIADLLLNIKILPFENLISTVAEALKESASKIVKSGVALEKNWLQQSAFPTELALLEMLHGCIRTTPSTAVCNCWPSLQGLFVESPIMSLPPKAVFIQFIMLVDFVQLATSSAIIEDKQLSRAAQDACQKLTEAMNVIVGWQLEQTTWLKRTLVVKHDSSAQKSQETSPVVEFATAPTSLAASENSSLRGSTSSLVPSRIPTFDTATQITVSSQGTSISASDRRNISNMRSSLKDSNNLKRDPTHSTQALFLLAEHLAELIDSICKSEDKERLLPLLHAVWSNTLPYLKAKNARNARFFLASSQLLASMSNFNYMRPVWRKATLDLLLDPAFFKMDMQSLKHWLVITDHLMTYDKTSFKELLGRISTTQNSTLSSLITSKEVEYEMRAQALKRLAFIILSSELGQYQAQLPDIQERLSDNLRLSQVPIVHAQVFLCYRVLLIRQKPQHIVSMWPSMVTELVHVLLQIEQQLSGTANVSDDLKCDRNDQWMQLYLAACKLLETLCTLPAGYLAQFQMCHWAFVNSVAASNIDSFVPFASRIDRLLRNKYGQLSTHGRKFMSASLINVKTLTSFSELRSFFMALATQNKTRALTTQFSFDKTDQLRDAHFLNGSSSYKVAINRLEHALYVDFAEHWQL